MRHCHSSGAPDLFAQMLDKLAANAVDFATGDPIEISLERSGERGGFARQ